jgi:hypothetical protein
MPASSRLQNEAILEIAGRGTVPGCWLPHITFWGSSWRQNETSMRAMSEPIAALEIEPGKVRNNITHDSEKTIYMRAISYWKDRSCVSSGTAEV